MMKLDLTGTVRDTFAVGRTGPTLAHDGAGGLAIMDAAAAPAPLRAGAVTVATLAAAGLTYPAGDGEPGQVMTTTGTGTLVFADPLPVPVPAPTATGPADSPTETPTVQGSAFLSLYGAAQTTSQWQVTRADDPAFATPLYDSGPSGAATRHSLPPGHLPPASALMWRCRYGTASAVSAWSIAATLQTGPVVAAPQPLAPADGASAVGETPTLIASAYVGFYGGRGHQATEVQVLSPGGAVIASSGTLGPTSSWSVPASILAVATAYVWRVRYQDSAGTWSAWSAAAGFTTAASFAVVKTPRVIGPLNGAVDVPETPTVYSSAFALPSGTDTHGASHWQIRPAEGSWDAPVWDSGARADALLSVVVPAGVLADGRRSYAFRVRHQGQARGWSAWSAEVVVTTQARFALIIGVALRRAGGGVGWWTRIDENGAPLALSSAFFARHPVYAGIVDTVIDGQMMVRIPKFYYRVGTVAGDEAGVALPAWWIADRPTEGFALHPAFFQAGAEIPCFYVSKYEISQGSDGKAQSVAGVFPQGAGFDALKALCQARNTGGVSGFRLWSIYDLAALQMLALVEWGDADSQTMAGAGNVAGSGVVKTGATTAVWRGIFELWGNLWHSVDGILYSPSAKIRLWDMSGHQTWVSTGLDMPPAGQIVSVATRSGDGFDARAVFLPAAVDSLSSNGSFGDTLLLASLLSEAVFFHGGVWASGANAGLFALAVATKGEAVGAHGGRLVKI